MGKVIFLDIDGTLTLPGSNNPPESAMVAVRLARQKGHKVLLCTGRNPAMMAPVYKLGFDGAVAGAGGYVFVGDEVLFDCPMPSHTSPTRTSENVTVFLPFMTRSIPLRT